MKQGEIWMINLNPTVGAEMKKLRPAVIVNDDALGKLPLKVIVPITDWKAKFEFAQWMVKLNPDEGNGLKKISAADCFQVRSVSINRFEEKLGKITFANKEKIKAGLKKVFSVE